MPDDLRELEREVDRMFNIGEDGRLADDRAHDDADLRDGCELLGLALGVDVCARAMAEPEKVTSSLEAQADAMFGLSDELVEISRAEYHRLLADAASVGNEIELTMNALHEADERQREQAEVEAEAIWPEIAAFFGWEEL
jgi:hypothetical protein